MAKKVAVTIDDEHLAVIDDIVDQLRAAGLRVDQIHPSVGIVTGEVSDTDRYPLSQITGVTGVADQTIFQVPPPESEIQ